MLQYMRSFSAIIVTLSTFMPSKSYRQLCHTSASSTLWDLPWSELPTKVDPFLTLTWRSPECSRGELILNFTGQIARLGGTEPTSEYPALQTHSHTGRHNWTEPSPHQDFHFLGTKTFQRILQSFGGCKKEQNMKLHILQTSIYACFMIKSCRKRSSLIHIFKSKLSSLLLIYYQSEGFQTWIIEFLRLRMIVG